MKLITKRLILREIKDSDLDSLIKGMNNLNISKGLIGVPYPYSKKKELIGLNMLKENQKKPREEYIFAINLKKNKMIGEIILSEVEIDHKTANFVYWINEKIKERVMQKNQ